jgi:hypothetical protein
VPGISTAGYLSNAPPGIYLQTFSAKMQTKWARKKGGRLSPPPFPPSSVSTQPQKAEKKD